MHCRLKLYIWQKGFNCSSKVFVKKKKKQSPPRPTVHPEGLMNAFVFGLEGVCSWDLNPKRLRF